jgi:hypothetical protein
LNNAENKVSAHVEYKASVDQSQQMKHGAPVDGNGRRHLYLCPIGQTLIQFLSKSGIVRKNEGNAENQE